MTKGITMGKKMLNYHINLEKSVFSSDVQGMGTDPYSYESLALERTVIERFKPFFDKLEALYQKRRKNFIIAIVLYVLFPILAVSIAVLTGLYFLLALIAGAGIGGIFHYISYKAKKEYHELQPAEKITSLYKIDYPIFCYSKSEDEMFLYDGGGLLPLLEVTIPFFRDHTKVEEAVFEFDKSDQFSEVYLDGTTRDFHNWLEENPRLKEKLSYQDVESIWHYFLSVLHQATSRENQIHEIIELPITLRDNPIFGDLTNISSHLVVNKVPNKSYQDNLLKTTLIGYEFDKIDIWNNEVRRMHQSVQGSSLLDTMKGTMKDIQTLESNIMDMLDQDLKEVVREKVPIDLDLVESYHVTSLCPKCCTDAIDAEKDRIDFARWVNNKVLGGVLLDEDLRNPSELLREPKKKEIEKLKYSINTIIEEKLPVAKEIVPIANADLPVMSRGVDGRYTCPNCGNNSSRMLLVDAVYPLAKAYKVRMVEAEERIIDSAHVIIQNISGLQNTKNNRMTNLGPYEVEAQESESQLRKIEADIAIAENTLRVINQLKDELISLRNSLGNY
ncbi:MAG: hypothetical protein GF308_09485 [Candidatus Heimdallarchaeota archaeon]|nr:hypothetical protein [Candidatus Heimdallarchaeota archaeon]